MLIAQKINNFITKMSPKKTCNNCIVSGLGLTQVAHAAQNTAALGTTSDFIREKGLCSICGEVREVIQTV